MYEMEFEWSDGELSNDTAPDLMGVIKVLLQEHTAVESQYADYEGAVLQELIVRKVS